MDTKKYEILQGNRKQREAILKLKSSITDNDNYITRIAMTMSCDSNSMGGLVHEVSEGLIPVISKSLLKTLDDEIVKLDKEFGKL